MTQLLAVRLPGDPAAVTACIEAMRAALADCPCDQEETIVRGDLAMCCRLSSVAPEADDERLPHVDPTAGLMLTADARLDDRDALCRALALPGDTPDGALIVAAWRCWGEDALTRLHGDYAFVAADTAQGGLVGVRDALGIRPLYYARLRRHDRPEGILIASDPRPLRAALSLWDGQAPTLDPAYVTGFVSEALMWHPTATFIAQIRKVPPGHLLAWNAEGATLRRWWHPSRIVADARLSPDDAARRLRPIVAQAVADRLRTPHPLGLHVSGGLDSSITAALTLAHVRARGGPAPGAWTWTPSTDASPLPPECEMLQMTARHLGLDVRDVALTAADVHAFLRLDPVDLPIENTMLYEGVTQRWAERAGVRVIVTGWGGDEGISFHGAAYHLDLLLRGHWKALLAELHRMRPLRAREVLSLLLGPILRRMRIYRERNGSAALTRWAARAARPLVHEGVPPMRPRAQQLWRLTNGNLSGRAESYAAFGARRRVTYVYPLLDRRVLETMLGFGAQVFRHGRESRMLARALAAPLLPDAVVRNPYKQDDTRIARMQDRIREALDGLARASSSSCITPDRARFVNADWLAREMASPPPQRVMRVLEAIQFAGVARDAQAP